MSQQHSSTPGVLKLDGALTVDLEDWQSALLPSGRKRLLQKLVINEQRVSNVTRMLLCELDKWNTKATFFVLGEIAIAIPELVREIAAKGHEIASHSPMHVPIGRINRSTIESLIHRDTALLEELAGRRPRGFRAPYFAVGKHDGWLLDILSKEGYWYDSSVVPTWTPLYGTPYAPKSAYFPKMSDVGKAAPDGRIVELPVTVWPSWRNMPGIPVGSGFFLKAWPIQMTMFGLRWNRKSNLPLVLYLHPGDVDTNKESVDGMSFADSVIQYFGAKHGISNLRILLREFRLTTISEAFSSVLETVKK